MFKSLTASLAILTLTAIPAFSSMSGRATSVSNIETVRLVQDKWFGSSDKTLNVNTVRVGDSINGLKINYIGCVWQTKTFKGWSGGPKYVAKANTYNCYAGEKKHQIGPGMSGPQLIMSVVKNVR